MAVSDIRQRTMPTMRDRQTGEALDYPEAVRLTKPINPQFRGEVSISFSNLSPPFWLFLLFAYQFNIFGFYINNLNFFFVKDARE